MMPPPNISWLIIAKTDQAIPSITSFKYFREGFESVVKIRARITLNIGIIIHRCRSPHPGQAKLYSMLKAVKAERKMMDPNKGPVRMTINPQKATSVIKFNNSWTRYASAKVSEKISVSFPIR